jgi:hypothetical protein
MVIRGDGGMVLRESMSNIARASDGGGTIGTSHARDTGRRWGR